MELTMHGSSGAPYRRLASAVFRHYLVLLYSSPSTLISSLMTDHAARSSQTLSSGEDVSSNASTQQALDIVERYRRGTITKAAALLTVQHDLAPLLECWERSLDEIFPTYVAMLDEVDSTNQDAQQRGEPRQSSPAASIGESDRAEARVHFSDEPSETNRRNRSAPATDMLDDNEAPPTKKSCPATDKCHFPWQATTSVI